MDFAISIHVDSVGNFSDVFDQCILQQWSVQYCRTLSFYALLIARKNFMYLLFIANLIKYNAYFRWTGPARYEKRDKKPKVQYTYLYIFFTTIPPLPHPQKKCNPIAEVFFHHYVYWKILENFVLKPNLSYMYVTIWMTLQQLFE